MLWGELLRGCPLWWFLFGSGFGDLTCRTLRLLWKRKEGRLFRGGRSGFMLSRACFIILFWRCIRSWRPFAIGRRLLFMSHGWWNNRLGRIGIRRLIFFTWCSFSLGGTSRIVPLQEYWPRESSRFFSKNQLFSIELHSQFNSDIYDRQGQV